jgi:hypothetical protein
MSVTAIPDSTLGSTASRVFRMNYRLSHLMDYWRYSPGLELWIQFRRVRSLGGTSSESVERGMIALARHDVTTITLYTTITVPIPLQTARRESRYLS